MSAHMRLFRRRKVPIIALKRRRFRRQQYQTDRLVALALVGTVFIVGVSVYSEPFDMHIWPNAIRSAMVTKKELLFPPSDLEVDEASKELRYYLDHAQKKGGIVLLTGPDATTLARKYASETTPCAYLDFRTMFDTNAYQNICFQWIGWKGIALNAMMKLSIFGSSLVNETLGRPEAQHSLTKKCFNNLRTTLRELQQQDERGNSFLVFDNFGDSVSKILCCKGEAKEKCQEALHSYVEMLSSFASENLCGVAVVWENFEQDKLVVEDDDSWRREMAQYVELISLDKINPYRRLEPVVSVE